MLLNYYFFKYLSTIAYFVKVIAVVIIFPFIFMFTLAGLHVFYFFPNLKHLLKLSMTFGE